MSNLLNFKQISSRYQRSRIHTPLFTLLLLFTVVQLNAQFKVTQANNLIDPETIIKTIFLGDGVTVTDVKFAGDNSAVGFFEDGDAVLSMNRGLVMTTGRASLINQKESEQASIQNQGLTGDAQLELLTPKPVLDVAYFEIKFIPAADTLRFRYVFSSEEYPDYNCSQYNDVFGFFISGPKPGGGDYVNQNIALVPEPNDPTGTTFTNVPVTINNVHGPELQGCPPSFEMFYNHNAGSPDLVYGGYLDVFIAQAIVTPCKEYTIKLAIGDGSDQFLDSGVFLEARSFGTGTLDVSIETVSLDGSIAEGCNPGELIFSLKNPVEEDYNLGITLLDEASGCTNSATNGVDYTGLPTDFIIPKGGKELSIAITAVEDNISESPEYICFEVQRDICTVDTLKLVIDTSRLTSVAVPPDITVCQRDLVNLKATLPTGTTFPDKLIFKNTEQKDLNIEKEPYAFDIDVTGVGIDELKNGIIHSICIDSIAHPFLTDLDFYLKTPSGQFLELSTDNGFQDAANSNGVELDYMVNTCFDQFSVVPINNGNPIVGPFFPNNPKYTGVFQPEGTWEDIFGADFLSNGKYQLIVQDDETGATGFFGGWSITFNPLYDVRYEWSSDRDGLICRDCDDIDVMVDSTTVFTLDLKDSYGCSVSNTFKVTTTDLLEKPENFGCFDRTTKQIKIAWDPVVNATAYELYVPGVVAPPQVLPIVTDKFTMDNLPADTEFQIILRALGTPCNGIPDTITCSTYPCGFATTILQQDSVSCSLGNDGYIKLETTAGFAPFDYQWTDRLDGTVYTSTTVGSGFGEFNMLRVNTTDPSVLTTKDTIVIIDDDGCISYLPIDISQPKKLNVDFNDVSPLSCPMTDDGAAKLNVFGGTKPYTYAWSNGATDATVSNLKAGMNYVTITDKNNCLLIDSVNIIEPASINIDILNIKVLSCNGGSDGSISIKPEGGTVNNATDYTIEWNTDPVQTGFSATGLKEGVYTVTVKDLKGCSNSESIAIGAPDPIVFKITGSAVSCFNSTDGTAEITDLQGGKSPYSFKWDNGETTNPATMLTPGSHLVTVTDDNGCSNTGTVDIQAPSEIIVTAEAFDPNCFGYNDGSISWTTIGGTGTITVTDKATGQVVTSPYENLFANTYTLVFTDQQSCSKELSFQLKNPDALLVDDKISNESCINAADGIIDLTVKGGTEPYTFSWKGPNAFTSDKEDISGLVTGVYMLTLTDAKGCSFKKDYTLDVPVQFDIKTERFNIACKGEATGIINTTINGTTEPYTYKWTGPNNFESDEAKIIDLYAGDYTLVVTDKNGCTDSRTITIIEPSVGVTTGISEDFEICYGLNNGVASVSPFGGESGYKIKWSTGVELNQLIGLAPGWYYVTVTDASNCIAVDSVEIIERSEITLKLDQEKADCHDQSTGTASVNEILQNNTVQDKSKFTYLWNSNPNQITEKAVSLKGGATYTVIVTDPVGCTATEKIEIENPEEVSIKIDAIDSISCAYGNDGGLTVSAAGGSAPYSYSWGQNTGFHQGAKVSNLNAGTYYVTATDSKGCTNVLQHKLVDAFPIDVKFNVFDVLCTGETTGRIDLFASGGKQPYTYLWSNGPKDRNNNGLAAGNYLVTITDAKDCVYIDSVEVDEPKEAVRLDVYTVDKSCAERQDGKIRIEAEGGSGSYIYAIRPGIEYNGSPDKLGLEAGVYTAFVKDKNGCIDSMEQIEIFSPPAIELELGSDVYLNFGQKHLLESTLKHAKAPLSYDWKSTELELLSCTDCPSPIFDAQRNAAYELIVTDKRGCIANDFINIYINNENAVLVPTGFTPNGDQRNDVLYVYGIDNIKINDFNVFDRWGELVYTRQDFDINDLTNGWDGTFKGQKMPPGVYTWVIKATFKNGTSQIFSGHTNLIR